MIKQSIQGYCIRFLALALLCHCSSKHQPKVFPPYYSEGSDAAFMKRVVSERVALEQKAEKSLLERKRYLDLLGYEATNSGSPSLNDQYAKLLVAEQPELEGVYQETEKVKVEILAASPGPATTAESNDFQDPQVKKRFREILKVWSRDENDKAFGMANQLLLSVSSASWKERAKVIHLVFRIAMDVGNEVSAQKALDAMREGEACSSEAGQEAFLLALRAYSRGEKERANQLLALQCDSDWTAPQSGRRRYWQARFGVPPSLPELNPIAPSYYDFLLAQSAKLELPQIPTLAKDNGFLNGEVLELPSSAEKDVAEAEKRIAVGLKADASWFLQRAARELKKDYREHWRSVLYVCSLFRAAGNHLESMRLISDLMALPDWNPEEAQAIFNAHLMDYATPFPERVEWLSRTWNIEPDFVYSLMRQESAFNPMATSPAGARGILQMMPVLGKYLTQGWGYRYTEFPEGLLYHSNENLKLSIFHLHQLSRIFSHPILVAAAYNAGIERVRRWVERFGDLPPDVFIEMIPVNETRNYIKLVMRNLAYYRALRKGGSFKEIGELLPSTLSILSTASVPTPHS